MIISLDAEKIFDKIQHPFMVKFLERSGTQGPYMNIVKQYTEKTIKKNNMLFNQYQKQNIWQKESDMQKNEQYHTINTEVIQNIVQNSLKEKQKQQQSQNIQYEQQKQSIDEETLFLHITEKLLEQRERSLKGNSFKI